MQLSKLIELITPLQVKGDVRQEITGIEIDSRMITAGNLFVAVKGLQTDGHLFISKAIEKGARAIIFSDKNIEIPSTVVSILVKNTEKVVGLLATAFYNYPANQFKLVGVTGTNGKTTIATTLYNLFRGLGYKCGLCSTIANFIDGKEIPATHTTPDPINLNKLLAQMADANCDFVFMECSSHAISQSRIAGLNFAGGIFTNLTRDHLDYHETFENYRDAKKAFFDHLSPKAFALTNVDDKNGKYMLQNSRAKKSTYSLSNIATYKAYILEESLAGMLLNINNNEVSTSFVGKFNAYNLLAIYGAALELGQEEVEVLRVLSTLHPVNGRFETLHSPTGFSVVIDYAHTPDALSNVLDTLNDIMKYSEGRVLTLCGAGGNRDKGKRPLMAAIAAEKSAKVILTSDNPRFEEPQAILQDMLQGLDSSGKQKTLTLVDRKEAIRTACMMAQPKDVILIAGKGHEPYQEINGVKHHFDDHEEVLAIFEELKD